MLQQQQIAEKIERMEKEIEKIKKNMVHPDSIMTEDDYKALLDYRFEKSKNKLFSHDKIKRELGLI